MSDQNSGERYNPTSVYGTTNQETYPPVVNTDPFVDKTPVDPALVHTTPMGGTLAAADPLNEGVTPAGSVAEMIGYRDPIVDEPLANEAIRPETVPLYTPVTPPVPFTAPIATNSPSSTPMPFAAPTATNSPSSTPLLPAVSSEHFRTRWNEIQGTFVDEPRSAVQQADALVAEVVAQITSMFTDEHTTLEAQWNKGNDVSTEDLRKALQKYRSFFNRLVV